VVLAAREPQEGTVAREALASLCSTYWYPLYAFIRRQGIAPAEAEDLTQEFFYQFLEQEALRKVAPANGKFRSFLLACLKHFLGKERVRAHAARRGGGCRIIPLESPEAQFASEPADNLSPEVLFDQRWAAMMLNCTLKDLGQEYAQRGGADLFEDLIGFLPGCRSKESRAELAARRQMSAGALDVAIHRLRRRFGVLLHQRLAQTVSTEEEVEAELRYLISVLAI
jgi:DNA-directed RNA polymerase specialized sigma24 family protein